ncbi:diguanylate cyclase domain-containing protein [Solicola sp. PLA-1-18]|uniref:sensor domain-containing diguanylate cyclase n=1 Tax=Solicola sp. PLA-1-18 TaxID=3380532 RepID=UPI003B78745C
MDAHTTRRAERWGAWGLTSVVVLTLAAAGFTRELAAGVLVAATAALVVGLVAARVRPPGNRRRWLMRWPLAALAYLVAFGQLAPTAGSLAAGFYVVVFVYIGIVAHARVGLLLLPVPALAIWSVLDLPTSQAVVRLSAAMLAVAMASQMPARLMESLAQRRRELALEHEAVLAAQSQATAQASKFSRVFEVSPVGMGLADEHGRFAEVNPALSDLLGRSPAELIGSGAEPFLHPDDRAENGRVEELMDASEDGVVELDQRFVRPDGSVVSTWVTLSPISGPDGERWTMAHVIDVTDRSRAEDEARHAQLLTEVVARIAQATQRADDPRPVAIDGMAELTGADAVFVIEEGTPGVLVVTHARGADVRGTEMRLDRLSVTSHVWSTGESHAVADLAADPMVNPALAQLVAAHSALWQPVTGADGTVAVLMAAWRSPTDLAPHRDTMAALATEVAAALTAEGMRVALERTAVTDGLTGLLNRRGWDRSVAPLMAQTLDRAQTMVLAMVDLDHFKAYNDSHGHGAGDDLLVAVADLLTSTLRTSDVVSRWGGDELAAALPACDLDAARSIFERFRAEMPAGQTCSVGLTACRPGETVAQAMARADADLYAAKAARPSVER